LVIKLLTIKLLWILFGFCDYLKKKNPSILVGLIFILEGKGEQWQG